MKVLIDFTQIPLQKVGVLRSFVKEDAGYAWSHAQVSLKSRLRISGISLQ